MSGKFYKYNRLDMQRCNENKVCLAYLNFKPKSTESCLAASAMRFQFDPPINLLDAINDYKILEFDYYFLRCLQQPASLYTPIDFSYLFELSYVTPVAEYPPSIITRKYDHNALKLAMDSIVYTILRPGINPVTDTSPEPFKKYSNFVYEESVQTFASYYIECILDQYSDPHLFA